MNQQVEMMAAESGDGGTGAPPARSLDYRCDAFSRLIERRASGSSVITNRLYYAGWQLIAEYNGAGALQRKDVYGPGIDEPVRMTNPQSPTLNHYFHADGLGSVTEVTDRFGLKAESYSYDVYGSPTIYNSQSAILAASVIGNRLLFTGCDRDPDTTLYNNRYRYYSPSLGRFGTPEALNVLGDGWNLYAYTENSPVNWADPDGLSKIKVSGCGVWSDEIEGDASHVHSFQGRDQGPHWHGTKGQKFFPRTRMIHDAKNKRWFRASNKFPKRIDSASRKQLGRGLGVAGIGPLLASLVECEVSGANCEQIAYIRAEQDVVIKAQEENDYKRAFTVSILPQCSLFPKGGNQPGSAAHAAQGLGGGQAQFPAVWGAEVRQFVWFEVAPDVLGRVQLGGIGGKIRQVEALPQRGGEFTDCTAAVNASPIPNGQQSSGEMAIVSPATAENFFQNGTGARVCGHAGPGCGRDAVAGSTRSRR